MVQDFNYSNMSLNSINDFLAKSDIKVSACEAEKLNSIFKECDTENAQGEKKPDGELSEKERATFLSKIKKSLPELFEKLCDFSIMMDIVDDEKKTKEATLKELEKAQKEENKQDAESIKFGLD